MATTVTIKGQVTIPKSVREHLGLQPGGQVEFRMGPNREIILERADDQPPPPSRFDRFRGIAGPGPTTDEIMRMWRGDDWGRED